MNNGQQKFIDSECCPLFTCISMETIADPKGACAIACVGYAGDGHGMRGSCAHEYTLEGLGTKGLTEILVLKQIFSLYFCNICDMKCGKCLFENVFGSRQSVQKCIKHVLKQNFQFCC